jgi:uncharacterized protein YegP (UPF0339 family)
MANDASSFTLFFEVRTSETRYCRRLRDAVGQTVAWSKTGYADKSECEAAIESMKGKYPGVPVVDLTDTERYKPAVTVRIRPCGDLANRTALLHLMNL